MASQQLHSPYREMTADEAVRSYSRRVLRLRATHLAIALPLGALGIYAALTDRTPLYLVCLAFMLLTVLVFFVRLGRCFPPLQDILWQDADVAKYRAVLEARAARVRNRRAPANLVDLELAFCDYFDGRNRDALARLDRISFRGARNLQWVRACDLRALVCQDLGDAAGRDDAMARLAGLCAGRRLPRVRVQLENLQRSLQIRFRPVGTWDEADVRFMREQLGLADKHLNRASVQIELAAWELAQGDCDAARRELTADSLEPLAPRQTARRARLLEQCASH